ncbi:MAG: TRAP transporter large permease subunit, partial [Gammaproteobacteria bacterium]|nr:TRAP transporter large permease subunit [Gammaproteobacteria bacterium]
ITLEKSSIAEDLLDAMTRASGALPGGLGLAVCMVGMLLAASTGIVGATVVTMGLMSLPTMLKAGYHPSLATGTICATGTLGQIIPPSIALVLLGDVIASAYQQAQLSAGIFNPRSISVGDLFAGAIIPGFTLVILYSLLIIFIATFKPGLAPATKLPAIKMSQLFFSAVPPILLIIAVLGSILLGMATPTEAAGVGALGALLLALSKGAFNREKLTATLQATTQTTSMVFFILIGASLFSLVFRGYGGDELVQSMFMDMPGGVFGATCVVMLIIFLLGFILDFIEITFVVVPIVGPILMAMGVDPIWLGIMIAINLQTSFLTPPFGFALFYLRGVASDQVRTTDIYVGVIPFIMIQLLLLIFLAWQPWMATWLPSQLYN